MPKIHNMVMLHIKSKGMKHTITCTQIFLSSHTPIDPLGGIKRSLIFSESSHVAYQIMGMKHRAPSALLHTIDPWAGSKGQKIISKGGHVAYQIKRKEV